ncbi:MAG: DMT family transporter [Candidatus Bipolaricaulia bacterium]
MFALIAYLGWGIGDVFSTIVTRKLGAYSTTFWNLVFGLLIFSPYIPFVLNDLQNITPGIFLLNIALAAVLIVGIVAFYEGLRIANPSLVGTIAASFAAVTVVLSIIFLKERITAPQTVAMLVVFSGLIVSTTDFNGLSAGKLAINRGIFLALVAMMSWGVYFTFIKIPVREIGWFWPAYISSTPFPLVFLFMRRHKIKLTRPNFKGALLPLVLGAFLVRVAELSFNFAIDRGLTAVVAPIAGAYPTLFVVLAFLVFKDPITKQQIAGIGVTLIGIVLLSIFS